MGLTDTLGLGLILTWRDRMSSQVNQANLSLKSLKRGVKLTTDEIEQQSRRAGLLMQRYRKGITTGAKIAGLGAVISAPFILAGREALIMQKNMADIELLFRATGDSIEEAKRKSASLKKTILSMAGTSIVGIDEMTEKTFELVSALGMVDAQATLPATTTLFVGGKGESFIQAVSAMSATMNTFGKAWGDTLKPQEKATKIANIYVGAIGALDTDLGKLQEGMKFAAADGVVLKVSLEETLAAIGMLQTKGLRGGRAGSSLSAMFRGMIQFMNKSKDGKAEIMGMSEALKGMTGGKIRDPLRGFSLADAEGKTRTLSDLFTDLTERLKSLTPVEKASVLLESFGEEPARAMKLFLGEGQAFGDLITQIRGSQSAWDAAGIRQEAVLNRGKMLKESFGALAITIGDVLEPAIRSVVASLTKLVNKIREFIMERPSAAKWIAWGGLATAAIVGVTGALITLRSLLLFIQAQRAMIMLANQGMIAHGIFFKFGNLVPVLKIRLLAMALATKVVAAAQWLWNVAMSANPLGLIIIGIAAVITAIVFMIKHWDWVVDVVKKSIAWIKKMVDKAPSWLLLLINPLLLIIKHWDIIKSAASATWGFIMEKGKVVIDTLVGLWGGFKDVISGIWDAILENIKSVINFVLDWAPFKLLFGVVDKMISFGKDLLGGEGSASPSPLLIPMPFGPPVPLLLGPSPDTQETIGEPVPAPASNSIADYSSNNFEVIINPPAGSDAKKIAKAVIDEIKDKQDRGPAGRW